MNRMNRREFFRCGMLTMAVAGAPAGATGCVPPHLESYADLFRRDPRAASLAWFRNAKFGLFLHYGLYSILGRGEWVMLHEKIPVAEYERLKEQFTARRFDADFITDLACEAGMRYVNLTSRHHDSFCLFETAQNDFHSKASPARRDLVAELADACRKKKLGLFLYYSYALDWRHPYFYSNEVSKWKSARPAYPVPEPSYRFRRDEDFRHYIEFVHAQLRELLTQYGPLAGVWFDPIMGYYARPDLFPIEETYALVRRLQPHCLISFKQGATGTEDFAAPERAGQSLEQRVRKMIGEENARIAARAWAANRNKWNEICDTLQPHVWGYRKDDDGKHLDATETLNRLAAALGQQCNLLMNTGPLPEGEIHPDDVATLRECGRRIRAQGWLQPRSPAASSAPSPGIS
ncbi:MAG: alpha-L-fucosidase [Kiritimatiellae bacterium]|nr:alpha-L-fucosidase [Kiritimatiellia bacterium]